MNAETFCEQFATFAEAPNGVAKLRELILQLAVQGKLGTQNENDEPATELIARIASELDGQQAAKRGKRAGSVSEEYSHAEPHDLPLSWCWARFNQVATIASNLVSPNDFAESPHVAPDNIEKGTGNLLACKTVAEDAVRSANHRFFAGQILYSKIRPNLSKAVIVDFDGLCSADMYPLNSHIDAGYLLRFILSSTFLGMAVRNDTRVAMPKINQEELSRILVAVPPLAEQRRIVGKVDQLLGLCDELAARQAARREARSALVGATLDRLVSARSAAEFPAHAHRLRDHFDRLFDTPTTLPQLRQAILQLAVQGQLVPQDPNDEPASVLLGRVRLERRRLWEEAELAKFVASSKTPKDTSWKEKYEPATVLERNDLFDLPLTWAWLSLDEIVPQFQYGPRFGAEEYVSDGIPTVRTTDMDYRGRVGLSDAPKVRVPPQAEGHWCLQPGDLLITRTGATIGKCALYDESWGKAIASAYLIRFRLTHQTVYPPFVLLLLMSPFGQRLLLSGATETAQPNVNATNISRFPFPLAPLSEQKRIVSKVTELLSLCDALEAKLTQAESASTQLLSAAVHHLLNRGVPNG